MATVDTWPDAIMPYTQLSVDDKQVVDAHLGYAGQLQMWQDVRTFLIDEFHRKKSRPGSNVPADPHALQVYSQCFFFNQEIVTSLDPFPCQFESELENVMLREFRPSPRFHFPAIYYNHQSKPAALKLDQFDKDAWVLDRGAALTANDRRVLAAYRKGLVGCLTQYATLVRQHFGEDDDRTVGLDRECARIASCFAILE
jgi:hypothetical protein